MKRKLIVLGLILTATFHGLAQAGQKKGSSVVIIDAGISSPASLLKLVEAGSKVVFIDGQKNPLESILQALETHAPVQELHIFSEGKSGQLQFAAMQVNEASLEKHADLLGKWQSHFSYGGDILLYGCEVAKGTSGINFVGTLAVFTGLDVAASDNHTGSSRKGGDWFLEVRSGRIESQIVVNSKSQEKYQAVLSSAEGGNGSKKSGNKNLRPGKFRESEYLQIARQD
jgi:hypothetical protein